MATIKEVKPDGGKLAAKFVSGGNDWLLVPRAQIGNLSPGTNTSFYIACWVNIPDNTIKCEIATVWDALGGNKEYRLFYRESPKRFVVMLSGDGTTNSIDLPADSFGVPADETWHLVEAYYDHATTTAGIRVDQGTWDTVDTSVAMPSGVHQGSADFNFHAAAGDTVDDGPLKLDEFGFWHDEILSAADSAKIWNSGNGQTFAENETDGVATPHRYWSFEELSGDRVDEVAGVIASAQNGVDNIGGQVVTADFTSLAGWEDFADGEASADQVAEVHAGGNAGDVLLAGWASTPSSSLRPTIRAAAGQSHNGDWSAGAEVGAIESQLDYVLLQDLRVVPTSDDGVTITANSSATPVGNTVERCLIDGAQNGILCDCTGTGPTITLLVLRNNVIRDATVDGIKLQCVPTSAPGEISGDLDNNTIDGAAGDGLELLTNHASATITVEVRNNVATNSGGADFGETQTLGTIDATYATCASSDGTADDFGGSGHLVDQADSIYADATADDFTPAAGSALRDAGTTIGDFSDDVLGSVRPRGADWDVGAFEAAPESDAAGGLGRRSPLGNCMARCAP